MKKNKKKRKTPPMTDNIKLASLYKYSNLNFDRDKKGGLKYLKLTDG